MNEIKVVLKKEKEYLTLNELLKITNVISTGGAAKWYLQENIVLVNGIQDQRRGRKLYPGDKIETQKKIFVIIEDDNSKSNIN